MKKIEVPFDYVINQVFLELLKYEGRRAIDIETLRKVYDCIVNQVMVNHVNTYGKNTYTQKRDKWPKKIELISGDFDNNLKMFLRDYSSYYNVSNNTIYLTREEDYDTLRECFKDSDISIRFTQAASFYFNKELMELLQVHKLRDLLEKYKTIEDEIEKSYLNLDLNNKNSIKEVVKSLAMRKMFYYKVLGKLSEERVDALRLISFDYSGKALKDYEVEPLSRELWNKNAFCADEDDEESIDDIFSDFDNMIYETYQFALYSKEPLAWPYIENFLDDEFITNLTGENLETTKEEEQEAFREAKQELLENEDENVALFNPGTVEGDHIFYITYLYNLMAYEKQYGIDEDLELVRKRLLYLLDSSELNLFIPDNLVNVYNAIKEEEFDIDDISYMMNEIGFMADEIFMAEPNVHIKKKLIFLRTYFDLTLDKDLCEVIDYHCDHPKYKEYSEVIYGLNRGKARALEKDE